MSNSFLCARGPGLLRSQGSEFPPLSDICRIQRGHTAMCGETSWFPVYFTGYGVHSSAILSQYTFFGFVLDTNLTCFSTPEQAKYTLYAFMDR